MRAGVKLRRQACAVVAWSSPGQLPRPSPSLLATPRRAVGRPGAQPRCRDNVPSLVRFARQAGSHEARAQGNTDRSRTGVTGLRVASIGALRARVALRRMRRTSLRRRSERLVRHLETLVFFDFRVAARIATAAKLPTQHCFSLFGVSRIRVFVYTRIRVCT